MNDGAALGLVLDQVSKDKNIDRAVLVETLEQAILTAAKRAFGLHREMEAKFNEETGRVDLFQIIVIVEQVTPGQGFQALPHVPAGQVMPAVLEGTGGKEVSLEDATRFGLKAEAGDELLFQIFYDEKDQAKAEEQDDKYGDMLKLNRAWKGFGRIAAQTAKQVILQRMRDAERENVFNEYKDRKGELITGIVRRFERGNIIVDLGRAEAVLPVREQVPRETYRAGDRIVAYVLDVDKGARGPQIILSRTHKGLLDKLFEMEVPEIDERIVRIEARPASRGRVEDRRQLARSRRRPGGRLRRHEGQPRAGGRAGAARREDRHRPLRRGSGALRVQRARARRGHPRHHRRGNHAMELIVPDDQLSLAIGRRGRTCASRRQLTGWRIDIHSESKVREMEARARQSLAAIKSGPDGGGLAAATVEALFQAGWRSAAEVSAGKPDELASITGIGGVAGAQAVIAAAASAAELERARHAEEAARAAKEAAALAEKAAAADRRRHRREGRQPGSAPGMTVATEIVHGCAHPDLHRVPTAGCRGRDGAVAVARAARNRKTDRSRSWSPNPQRDAAPRCTRGRPAWTRGCGRMCSPAPSSGG